MLFSKAPKSANCIGMLLTGPYQQVVNTFPTPNEEKKRILQHRLHVHQELCMAKHANPMLQKAHGVRMDKGIVTFFNGPDTGEQGAATASYAIIRPSW
jgi:hypothetical protein